ncbi:MAG: tetratricopeptide repeat protein [Bacteroidales bacterium]|nr:tetratricopeptide repeat protein [Bacteroidales bacterium]MBQ3843972.1 tetratricopeptide repeat protein [Bacteroidales bacterium]
MKRIYLLVFMMVAAIGLKAQTIQNQEFTKANFYYNESRYDTALVIYEKILNEGYVSVPLLYNIGNTYFKLRNYPMAILHYEKALKIDPTNEDTRHNLAIANALITDKIEPMPVFFLTKWWRSTGNLMSANGWTKTSLELFGLLLVLVFLYITARTKGVRKTTFFSSIIVLILLVCSSIFSYQKHKYLNERNEAIVMTPTITVKSSPSASGVDLFVLHEGSKVEIIDNADKWDKIKIADGSVGWMLSTASIKY